MCIQDYALARRTRVRTRIADVVTDAQRYIAGDPTRLTLAVGNVANGSAWALSITPDSEGVIYMHANITYHPTAVLSVRDYGVALTGPLWLIDIFGTSPIVHVTEILADFQLDSLIQKAV